MEYRRDIWFSPRKILLRYDQKMQEIGEILKTGSQYKIIREARSVALMLLGIEKLQEREYWLQLVDSKLEQTPDIRTATHMVETDRRLAYQDVEVITLESHSKEDVDDFLKKTKLSAKKSYQKSTIILCHIDKNTSTKSWREISSNLSNIGKDYDIYLLGRTDPVALKYQLARVYPKFDGIVIFDALEEAINKARDTMKFIRSTEIKEWKSDVKSEPF